MANLALAEFLTDYIIASVEDPNPFDAPYPQMVTAAGKIDIKQLLSKARSGGVKALLEPLKALLSKVKSQTAKKIVRGLKQKIGMAFNWAKSRNMKGLRKLLSSLMARIKKGLAKIKKLRAKKKEALPAAPAKKALPAHVVTAAGGQVIQQLSQYLKKKGQALKKLKGPAKKIFKVVAALVILSVILELYTWLLFSAARQAPEEFMEMVKSL